MVNYGSQKQSRSLIPQIQQETRCLKELSRHSKTLEKHVLSMCGNFCAIIESLFENQPLQRLGDEDYMNPYYSPYLLALDDGRRCEEVLESLARLFRVNKSLRFLVWIS